MKRDRRRRYITAGWRCRWYITSTLLIYQWWPAGDISQKYLQPLLHQGVMSWWHIADFAEQNAELNTDNTSFDIDNYSNSEKWWKLVMAEMWQNEKITSGWSLSEPRIEYEDFLDAQASLAPTHLCPSVGPSHFRISNLSASLVVLRENLKREDPNYF